jgi:hypothetical protein
MPFAGHDEGDGRERTLEKWNIDKVSDVTCLASCQVCLLRSRRGKTRTPVESQNGKSEGRGMLDIDAGISQEKGQSSNNRNASMTVGADGIILGVQKNGSVKGEQASEGGPASLVPRILLVIAIIRVLFCPQDSCSAFRSIERAMKARTTDMQAGKVLRTD